MAGFKKSAVIDSLKARLAEQGGRADDAHEVNAKSWENLRDEIQRAKKNVRQAVRDLTDGKLEIEEFSKRLTDDRGRYGSNWLSYSARIVPPKPKRAETPNHKALTEKIALVEAYEGDAVTVNEMKALGILGWVKG